MKGFYCIPKEKGTPDNAVINIEQLDKYMKTETYYLQSVVRVVDKPNSLDYLEAIYSNGKDEVYEMHQHGEEIKTILKQAK